MKPIKTLKSDVVYENPYCKVKEDFVLHQNGFKSHYHFIDANNFAAVIPVDENGMTYMVRQYRYPAKAFSLEFPMGGINAGETGILAAKRELLEETGIKAKKFKFLGKINPEHGRISNAAFCFMATNLISFESQSEDQTECLELVKLDLREVDDLIIKGEIFDGPTVFLKHLYDINLKFKIKN